MADDDHPVGNQRLLPVAARGADGQEVEHHDVLGELGHQRRQAFDALDDALSLGAFVDPGGVVLPVHVLAEAAVAYRFRPAGEDGTFREPKLSRSRISCGRECCGIIPEAKMAQASYAGCPTTEHI